ncbi:hypothetical protein CVT26_013367 [Gymnopilus dilepis]|uniref:Uncharacterized protein n=1 Tax=Gymnopilus dilepis TaxID=231916 RepID=A0A409WVA2_9AGAR|nr:hypothetical protein CVT26_013367 [Gymnopilus dilepis]
MCELAYARKGMEQPENGERSGRMVSHGPDLGMAQLLISRKPWRVCLFSLIFKTRIANLHVYVKLDVFEEQGLRDASSYPFRNQTERRAGFVASICVEYVDRHLSCSFVACR